MFNAHPPLPRKPQPDEPSLDQEHLPSSCDRLYNRPSPAGYRPVSDPEKCPMATVIALCNQKGGVGKTTTVVNLGAALAEHGQRVLMVDLDPQAALTDCWGQTIQEQQLTIYDLLLNDTLPIQAALQQVRPLIELVPADVNLAAAEIELFSALGRERVLKDLLAGASDGYDTVLIDCPPNLGLLTVNALVASDGIIVPLQCEYLALRGFDMLLETLSKIKRRLNPSLEIIGVLATLYNTGTRHAREVLDEVRESFGVLVFDTVIHNSIRFAESSRAHLPILEYESSHPGAQAYRALAKEILHATEPTQ